MLASLTDLGDAALTLSIATACAIWLAISSRRIALMWLMRLAGGMALVGATKVTFAISGMEVGPIGFRMISGHAMLSTAVWTIAVTLIVLGHRTQETFAFVTGLLIGASTGTAHVPDHSHTAIEATVGWVVGATIAISVLRECRRSDLRPVRADHG
jgi:hypothetical protein